MSILKYYDPVTSQWVPVVAGATGYTGSQGDIGYVGSSAVLTVSLINTDNTYSNVVSNVNTLRFDTDAGFDVTDLSNGEVKIGMNSTFKYWDVDGQETLIAEGIDRIQLIAGDNISLTTRGYVGSTKALTISATIATGYTGSASTEIGYTGSQGVKGDPGVIYWASRNW